MRKIEKPVVDLDEEEQALSDSFDRGEWKSISNIQEEMPLAKQAARNYFRENDNLYRQRRSYGT